MKKIEIKKIHLTAICMAVAAVTLGWSFGVESDLFASPVFSSFWWLSYYDAHYIAFFIPSLGASALLFGISFWPLKPKKQ
jgi:hypothetical protein